MALTNTSCCDFTPAQHCSEHSLGSHRMLRHHVSMRSFETTATQEIGKALTPPPTQTRPMQSLGTQNLSKSQDHKLSGCTLRSMD